MRLGALKETIMMRQLVHIRHHRRRLLLSLLVGLALVAILLTGCRTEPVVTTATDTPAPVEPTAQAEEAGISAETAIRHLTILYTNDEHGWMAGQEEGSGAAELLGLWQERHDCFDDDSCVILSGGDMWTGPAISTWFEGEGMAETLNAMGYAAAAVGNHEFDFGLDTLSARAAQSTFPFVSANIRYVDTGEPPLDLGIRPNTLVERNGVVIGVVGLSTRDTPESTAPYNVEPFTFIDYDTALRDAVADVQAQGAQVVIVLGHLCRHELRPLAPLADELGIHMLTGGHCNEGVADSAESLVTLIGGSHMASYAWADLTVDTATGAVTVTGAAVEANQGGSPDPAVQAIVDRWQARTDDELDVGIGYLANDIPRHSAAMQRLITETWLEGVPNADVALTNLGGMRDDLRAGEITYADLISVAPFNNVLVEVQLTGAELLDLVRTRDRLAVGGMARTADGWVLTRTGASISAEATYRVLVNDFMYAGGDDYTVLAQADPAGYNTAIDWRQPTLDWIIAQNSSAEAPLNEAIAQLGAPAP